VNIAEVDALSGIRLGRNLKLDKILPGAASFSTYIFCWEPSSSQQLPSPCLWAIWTHFQELFLLLFMIPIVP